MEFYNSLMQTSKRHTDKIIMHNNGLQL